MVTITKLIGGPGSAGFFALFFLIGLWLSRKRRSRGAFVLVPLAALYLLLSLPFVAHGLADGLADYVPLDVSTIQAPIGTLAVLGGDNGVAREREARRLAVALRPARAVVLGDHAIARGILQTGFRRDRIVEDDGAAATTRAQMAYLDALPQRDERMVVVASRLQMPRVVRLARARRLEIVPAPSNVDVEPASSGWRGWIPSRAALHVSRDAIYEYAAHAYYRWRGWFD